MISLFGKTYPSNYITIYTTMLTTTQSGWLDFGWFLFASSKLLSFSNEYIYFNSKKNIFKKMFFNVLKIVLACLGMDSKLDPMGWSPDS